MLELSTLVLASGAKGFFEDPAYLLGIPLVALGTIGLLLVLSPIGLQRQPVGEARDILEEPPEGRPSAAAYIQIGLILAVITAVEVAVFYVDVLDDALPAIVPALLAVEFALVAVWLVRLRIR